MAIDKKRLDDYIYYINSLLKQEDFYDTYMEGINKGNNKYTIAQRFQKKKFDLDWVEAIEECVVSLDTIVRNPRKFIVVEEDIVDVSLARNITTESVKHLATHTNYIASVKPDGMVIPSKILNTSKEESFEVYENRFIYTLLLKLHQFVSTRFEAVRRAAITSDNFTVSVESEYQVEKEKIKYKMETWLEMPLDEVLKADPTQLTDVERIVRLQNVVSGFMASPFAKQMVSCALVRPPIIRTNVILKNPDFKKALVLWQFIDSYQQTGYEIKSINETAELPAGNQQKFANLIYLNNLLTESIVRTRTAEEDVKGEEEQKKDEKIQANEYVTKNIDDFVPDDFPELKLSMFETKRLFTHLPEIGEISVADQRKIAHAIERCLLQYKINKAKTDSEEQARLMRRLMDEETKAKVAALKAAKAAEKKKAKEMADAEKRFAKEQREQRKIEKERARREAEERAERLRIEEEQAMRERLAAEQKEAERRIVEENERLEMIYNAVKSRLDVERQTMRDQLERERQLQFLEPIESEAMLRLRRKEQQRIRQMRHKQELALRELITAHYQDMERQQQQAILDMEQIADMCDFDIFDDSDVGGASEAITPTEQRVREAAEQAANQAVEDYAAAKAFDEARAKEQAVWQAMEDAKARRDSEKEEEIRQQLAEHQAQEGDEQEPQEIEQEAQEAKQDLAEEVDIADEDIPEIDTSLTTRDAEGRNEFAHRLAEEEARALAGEEEEDPTAARSEMSSNVPQSFAPTANKSVLDDEDDDIDIGFSGFEAPLDATAKYEVNYGRAAKGAQEGHIVRPSAMIKPNLAQLNEDWDFAATDELTKKEEAETKEEAKETSTEKVEIRGGTVQPRGRRNEPLQQAAVFMPKPRNTVSATTATLDEILGNRALVGNNEEEDDKKKKKKRFHW